MNSEKLRILIVSHAYIVGVNQGKLNAIANTDQVEVGLLAPKTWRSGAWGRTLEIERPYSNIEIHTGSVAFSGRGGACMYSPIKLFDVVRTFRPDVIQVEEEVFSLCALQLSVWSRITGKPLVVFGWENMERNLSWFRNWVRKSVLSTAQLIIAGNKDGQQLLKQWGYEGKIEVMPQMGVDTQLFPPSHPDKRADPVRIGFLGRIVPEKGIDLLLEAARHLKEKSISFEMIVCGSGDEADALKTKASEAGISDSFSWQGAVRHEEVPDVLKAFDVLVLPSRTIPTWREQFGHILIEAMSMGIPVVGSTCGEIPNVIGRSDLVFPEGDAQKLSEILERLIVDASDWSDARQYCLERVRDKFTHEKIAERLILLWRDLLPASRQQSHNQS